MRPQLRQADTAAMARHFAEQGTPIWLPQIDWGGANAGFVESEFPLYPFLVSRLYGLMGVQEWLGRGLSVFCSALAGTPRPALVHPPGRLVGGPGLSSHPWGCTTKDFSSRSSLVLCAAGSLKPTASLLKDEKRGHRAELDLLYRSGTNQSDSLLWLGLALLLVQLTFASGEGGISSEDTATALA